MLYPAVTTISILNLWHCTITLSTAELGSIGKFWGLYVVPEDGIDAVWVCGSLLGSLLASCDNEATWFSQEQGCRHSCGYLHGHSHGNSCGQVAVVCCRLHLSLHGVLVLVATVVTAMMVITPAAVTVT